MVAATICRVLEPKNIKSVTISIALPSICHEVMGLDAITYWCHHLWMPSYIDDISKSNAMNVSL